MNGYGRKGGVGPTAGKTASHYTATAPDGTVVKTRSFDVHASEVAVALYQDGEGRWRCCGVRSKGDTFDDYPASGTRVVVIGRRPIPSGFRFLHRHWLAEDCKTPLECVVTAVLKGVVYFKPVDGGASSTRPIEEFFEKDVKKA